MDLKNHNNKEKQLYLQKLIDYLNISLPPQRKLSYDTVMQIYGSNPKNRIFSILRRDFKIKKPDVVIIGPYYELHGSLWYCYYNLSLSGTLVFLGVGVTKKDSQYKSNLALVLWLDKVRTQNLTPNIPRATEICSAQHKILNNGHINYLSNLLQSCITTNLQNVMLTNNVASPLEKVCKNVGVIANPFAIPSTQTRCFATRSTDISHSQSVESIPKEVTSKNLLPLTESTTKEEVFIANHDTELSSTLFPLPKNALHNILALVAKELKSKTLKSTPQYKVVKVSKSFSQWNCTYHLKWPEDIKFSAKAHTKLDASHKAALAALTWLKKNGKITDNGHPIIFSKDEIKKLTRATVPTISLGPKALDNIQEILNIHETEMAPLLAKSAETEVQGSAEEPPVIAEAEALHIYKGKPQKYLGVKTYIAKEKVELPIAAYKTKFIELLKNNNTVIVKGEPGCGKSTRIPQYVLESWALEGGLLGEHFRIAVTQPRRLAAISLAERVANERDESVGNIVGYQVRLKSNYNSLTGRILYCTTGILLRHFQADQTLSKFTHVILDEAHERDVNTDLLMNLMRHTIKKNPNLKLVLMSATIDTGMFQEYYDGAPVLEIPGFTYPVKQHFLDDLRGVNVQKTVKMCESQVPSVMHENVVNVISHIHKNKSEGAILCFLPGWEDISKVQNMLKHDDIFVYCLHSRLQDSDQWKIFSKPPPGIRKVILATNIAETSVTIDDVVYVVDTGIQKEQRFDIEKGVMCIDNHWISQANVTQRKGRAGRCQPGESFHLYPRSKYDAFTEYALPEILRTSLTKIVLDSKVFSNNMNAIQFMNQLPCPPDENATNRAVEELKDLELLNENEKLTPLGRTLSDFQLEPKLAKAMVHAVIFKCVTPIVDIITLFSSETEMFSSGLTDKETVRGIKQEFCDTSDHLAMMRLFEKWLELDENNQHYKLQRFCADTKLVPHKLNTIAQLRKIHFDYLYNGLYEVLPMSDDHSDNDEVVKAVLYSGVGTVLQHRDWDIVKNRYKNNVNVLLTRHNHKANITQESVNFKRSKYPTNFLVYINETRSNIRRITLVRECSLISNLAVLLLSNKTLEIRPVDPENSSSTLESNDQVLLCIVGTKIKFLCDRAQAQTILKCKEALHAGYAYYIHQLTEGGLKDENVNGCWDKMLQQLSDVLKYK